MWGLGREGVESGRTPESECSAATVWAFAEIFSPLSTSNCWAPMLISFSLSAPNVMDCVWGCGMFPWVVGCGGKRGEERRREERGVETNFDASREEIAGDFITRCGQFVRTT